MQGMDIRAVPKADNRGMTLVEVVLSIVILAIVTVAISLTLITSAKYNGQANQRQHAVLAAESIMETFKGYEVSDICQQFDTNSFVGTTSQDFLSYSGPVSGVYTFLIQGLQTENKKYDARITLTPATVDGDETQSLSAISDLNPYRDGILRTSLNMDYKAEEQILDQFQYTDRPYIVNQLNTVYDLYRHDYTVDDIPETYIQIKKRESYIDISRASSMITATLRMKYYYEVTCPYYNATDGSSMSTITFPTSGSMYSVDVKVDISSGSTTKTFYKNPDTLGLDRIFIYYYPAYDLDDDYIEISTHGITESIECYLLKQVPSVSEMSTVTLKNNETSYHPTVVGESLLKLRHNLHVNISGAGVADNTISPSYFGESMSYMDTSLVQDDYCLLYQIEVEIMDEGESTPILTLTGTKND